MANVCGRARQALKSCNTRNAVVSKLFGNCKSSSSSSLGANASKLPGFAAFNKPNSRLFSFSRLPVELGCVQSMMPLHSATASALSTSLLSLHALSWGSLSEGTILDDS